MTLIITTAIVLVLLYSQVGGFLVERPKKPIRIHHVDQQGSSSLPESTAASATSPIPVIGVVAPLLYRGLYACLGLEFPHIHNASSSGDNAGVSLEFVLDTGANVNTLDSRMVQQFQLPVAYTAQELNILGRAGVGGTFDASDQALYRLGDCRLANMPAEFQQYTFMTNLTVASLPFAGPTGAGLLGLTFFASFAGVELDWHGTDGDPPTMVYFFYNVPDLAKNNSARVALDMSMLVPSIEIVVNGTPLRAILDTGSPLTILSPEAARLAGIETVETTAQLFDPLALAKPQRQYWGDDTLTIGGVDGAQLELRRSKSTSVDIHAESISFGSGPVYVGELPLFSMLERNRDLFPTSSTTPMPTVILGLDVLKRTYRMILQVGAKEVWFEELPSTLN